MAEMSTPKLSLCIPYRQRLDNLRLTFGALSRQLMAQSDFEVVIGAMEYSTDYIDLCREFSDHLNIVSVVTNRDFHIPQARNLAMRQARGEVIVQMDADTFLPPEGLRTLYDRHFAFGQDICVVGQVVGYGNNEDGDVSAIEIRPYESYVAALAELVASPGWPTDQRFRAVHVIPWAFGWTGLIALRRSTVAEHDLFFDEEFRGWGVDDLEWSYRICATGTPIVLAPDVYALHLPHVRDSAANRATEERNYRRFLRKWQTPDVELSHAFGDVAANGLFLEYSAELAKINAAGPIGSLRGRIGGRDVVLTGAPLDASSPAGAELLARFDDRASVERLTLIGLALPYDDKSVDECQLLPALSGFSAKFQRAARAEAERVAKQVTSSPTRQANAPAR
jgi:glycosyltransferase involved in cell wall biosynthesis